MLPLFQQKIAMGSEGFPFSLRPEIQYGKGLCPTVERIHEEEFLFFEPCMYTISENDKHLLKEALYKVYDNIHHLAKKQR